MNGRWKKSLQAPSGIANQTERKGSNSSKDKR
jgi:hypothetical protein